MVRAIAFDFDGVLVESEEIKTSAFAQLFTAEGPEVAARIVAYHRANGGVSRFEKFRTIYRDILQRPLDEATFQTLCDRFAALVVGRSVAAPWVEGAREFLTKRTGRYQFFVVSGTPEQELKDIMRRRGMAQLFAWALGSPRTKDVLLRGCLAQASLRPGEMAFVGDSETDWAAAREVEVPFIWRQSSEGTLEGFEGPRIRSLNELDRCLSQFEHPEPQG